jgi:hypothetical protein
LPEVSRTTLVWRLYFLVGAALTASRPRAKSVHKLTQGMIDHQNPQELVNQMVKFASAGFMAFDVSPTTTKQRAKK